MSRAGEISKELMQIIQAHDMRADWVENEIKLSLETYAAEEVQRHCSEVAKRVREETIKEYREIIIENCPTKGCLSCDETVSLLTPTPESCKHDVWLKDYCLICSPNPSTKEK